MKIRIKHLSEDKEWLTHAGKQVLSKDRFKCVAYKESVLYGELIIFLKELCK